MYTLGIDIGASSVKLAAVSCDAAERAARPLLFCDMRAHQGDPISCLRGILDDALRVLSVDECAGWAVVGQGQQVLGPSSASLEDVPAVTLGASLLAPEARSIIEIGGQRALYVTSIAPGQAPLFAMNDGCAAGTGSFFEDQMHRLNMRIEDFSDVVEQAEGVARLSGRCAVFAKTDIVHRQQEGVPIQDILLGLCYAVVKSFKALVVRGLPVHAPVALSGGVLLNGGVARAVREVFGLSDEELALDRVNLYFQATGAALHAASCGKAASLDGLAKVLEKHPPAAPLPRLEALPFTDYEPGLGYEVRPEPWPVDETGLTPCALGIDVGSTSTNLVLLDARGNLLDAQYLRTRGDAKDAVARGLTSLGARLGGRVRVDAVAATGSGRSMIGEYVGADLVRDEITAQGRAAVAVDGRADTVFEIGGQDSKYIRLNGGQVVDFQMNRICAAGTGSFIEEQAARLGIAIDEYGALALSSDEPVDLGERCTVFVETAINTALAAGAAKRDIAAGLCQSVVRNYLHRVVAGNPVGNRIVLQGGVNYNTGIVAAFKQFYGERVRVSPWFAVSGAVGAALLAWEADVGHTAFRGFDLSGAYAEKREVDAAEVERCRAFFHQGEKLMLEAYSGVVDPAKKTVGVPRCLMMFKLFPLANAFFTQLGFNVVISDMSDEETVGLSQQSAHGETCFPVKLIYGHMLQLANRGVDYIFMPSIHTIRHAKSKVEHNYGCPYMHVAPGLVASELGLTERGIELLSPLLDLDFGQRAMAQAMLDMGVGLGCEPREVARAVLAGGFAVKEFTRKTEEAGARLLDSLGSDERVLVMVTRNYGISDAVLSSGIPDALIERGQKVITISHLRAHDVGIEVDYPNVYWPFGQHVLAATKIIRRDPRLFAVYLTNHGCGPDTMLAHLVAEEMGDKPYLHIEVDEHCSKVGMITRIEAFLNSLDHYRARDDSSLPLFAKIVDQNDRALEPGVPIAMPDFGAVSRTVAGMLERKGFEVRLFPATPQAIARGRERSTAKEYLTFSAELGMALDAADSARGSSLQLLLPSSQGADADGLYDRVIRSVMDERGSEVSVVAPRLEALPDWSSDPGALFDALLAADVVQAAGASDREAVLSRLLKAGCAFGEVLREAHRVGEAAAGDASTRVLAVGEWPVVWDDNLNSGTLARLEASGTRVLRMPAAEYFWFLWCDARRERARGGGSRGRGENRIRDRECGDEALAAMVRRMAAVHAALGEASAFQPDPEALASAADGVVGSLHAANARYRAAKTRLAPQVARGVLALASMYENTDVILRLEEAAAGLEHPVMHVAFDGALDASIDDRINSFVYYL